MNIAIASLTIGLIFGSAQMPSMQQMQPNSQASEVRQIEQPIETKIAVTIAGLGLMGLELWWFLLSKPDRPS